MTRVSAEPLSNAPTRITPQRKLDICGALSALAWLALALASHQTAPVPLWLYFAVLGGCWAALAARRAWCRGENSRERPHSLCAA